MSLRSKALLLAVSAVMLSACGSDGKSTLTPKEGAENSILSEADGSQPVSAVPVTASYSMTLIKGETRPLDISTAKNAAEPEIVSSDSKIVSVNGKNITANACGDAELTVTVNDGDASFVSKIKVTVKLSRFEKSLEYTAAGFTSDLDEPSLIFHKELKAGSDMQLKIEGSDEVKYSSSDDSIATVSADGKITAVKEGQAMIRADVSSQGKTCSMLTSLDVYKSKPSTKLDQDEIDAFFSKAAFIGSSLGSGQLYYFNAQDEGFLGDPTFLVLDSYGIFNDEGLNGSAYQLSYEGATAPVRELLPNTGCKYAFVNVGTNDMYGESDYVSEAYIDYIKGITRENPEMVVYIESITPVVIGSEEGYLNNDTVDSVNKAVKEYCDSEPDVYFIDVSTDLKDDNGGLRSDYSSDGYVHLNNDAYEIWTNKLISTVKNQLIYEQKAEDAVETYEEAGTDTAKKAAEKALEKLGEGRYKTELKERLK